MLLFLVYYCIARYFFFFFFFSSRRRHTRLQGDWSSDVCSSDLGTGLPPDDHPFQRRAAAAAPPTRGPRYAAGQGLGEAGGRPRRAAGGRRCRAARAPRDRGRRVRGAGHSLGGPPGAHSGADREVLRRRLWALLPLVRSRGGFRGRAAPDRRDRAPGGGL